MTEVREGQQIGMRDRRWRGSKTDGETDSEQKTELVYEIIDCRVCWVCSAVVAGSRARSLVSAKHGAMDISGSLTNSVLIGT